MLNVCNTEITARHSPNHNDPSELMVELDFDALRTGKAPESFLCDLGDLVVQTVRLCELLYSIRGRRDRSLNRRPPRSRRREALAYDREETADCSWESDHLS
jgi:hypothetical protein